MPVRIFASCPRWLACSIPVLALFRPRARADPNGDVATFLRDALFGGSRQPHA